MNGLNCKLEGIFNLEDALCRGGIVEISFIKSSTKGLSKSKGQFEPKE